MSKQNKKKRHIIRFILLALGIGVLFLFVIGYFFEDSEFWDNKDKNPYTRNDSSFGLGSSSSDVAYETAETGLAPSERSRSDYSASSTSQTSSGGSTGVLTQRKIIKNGLLSIFVKEVENVASQIHDIAVKYEGFVLTSRVYEVSSDTKSGTVTIKVPASSFDKVFEEIKGLAVKVENEESGTEDVTEEYIDLKAQLKNLQAEETQYLEIMKSAKTVDETLQVSQRLAEVRGRIEQIQGQIQYLERQVDMSTITVSLTAEADVEVFGVRWRPLYEIKLAFRNMLKGLADYADGLIKFIFRLPVVILWLVTIGLIVAIGFRISRWFIRRFLSLRDFFQPQEPKKNGKNGSE